MEMERTPKWLKMCRSWDKYYPSEKVNYSTTVCYIMVPQYLPFT